jgi:hypothetical protein
MKDLYLEITDKLDRTDCIYCDTVGMIFSVEPEYAYVCPTCGFKAPIDPYELSEAV